MWCLSPKPHFQNKELKWHRKQNSIPGSYLYQQCFQKKCFRICIIQACRVDVMWSRLIKKELSLGKKQTDISPALQPYDIIITITSLGKASLLKLKIFCQIFQTIMITILSFTFVLGKWLLKISMFFSSVFSSCLNFQSFSHGWICSTFLKKNKRTRN